MDDSAVTKAIIIGVSIFLAIATITGVLAYYNSAKDLVKTVGTGPDFDYQYSEYIESILLKTGDKATVTGIDVKNILNYFYKDEKVIINVKNANPLYSDDEKEINSIKMNKLNANNDEVAYKELIKKIIPSQLFKLTKNTNNGILTIDLIV